MASDPSDLGRAVGYLSIIGLLIVVTIVCVAACVENYNVANHPVMRRLDDMEPVRM